MVVLARTLATHFTAAKAHWRLFVARTSNGSWGLRYSIITSVQAIDVLLQVLVAAERGRWLLSLLLVLGLPDLTLAVIVPEELFLGAIGCSLLGILYLEVLRCQTPHRVSHRGLAQLSLSELVLVLCAILGFPVGEHF